MTRILTDTRAPYRADAPDDYAASTVLTDEPVDIDADSYGVALTNNELFMDGWLVLPWADVVTLILVLTEALAWHAHDMPSDAPGRRQGGARPSGRRLGRRRLHLPDNAPGEASR